VTTFWIKKSVHLLDQRLKFVLYVCMDNGEFLIKFCFKNLFLRLLYEDEESAYLVNRMNNSRRYDENDNELSIDFDLKVVL